MKRWTGTDASPNANPATYFYYEGWKLIDEGPGGGQSVRRNVFGAGPDEMLWSHNVLTDQQIFYHYDARGHVIFLTDWHTGNLLEQYEYDAFGKAYFYNGYGQELINSNGTPRNESNYGNRFLFTGREWLSELGIYDYRHRMYHPEVGRFLQPDPKHFEAGDYNLYRYCHNDPINKSDPDGLEGSFYNSTPGHSTSPTQFELAVFDAASDMVHAARENIRNDPGGTLGAVVGSISRGRIQLGATNRPAVVIGRNMQDRVIPMAKKLGADYYKPRSKIPENWLKNNIRWFKNVLKQDRKVIDIGPDPNNPKRSIHYEAEKKLHEEHIKNGR